MKKKIAIKSRLSNVKKLSGEVIEKLSILKLDHQFLLNIKLAIEEALINAIRHGNKLNPALEVTFSYCIDSKKVSITVKDQGEGYDYHKVPNATDKKRLLTTSGRGLFLIRYTMDEVKLNKSGNQITMVKYLPSPKRIL